MAAKKSPFEYQMTAIYIGWLEYKDHYCQIEHVIVEGTRTLFALMPVSEEVKEK